MSSAAAPPGPPRPRRRVLLGQLISNGDCLYATAVAHQIKHDDPDCHLTWAISERCQTILQGNPHVDALWVWPAFPNSDILAQWEELCRQARARQARGEFDEVHLTQFTGENLLLWDGNLRSTMLRAFGRPLSVPLTPVVRLCPQEIERVRAFAALHGLSRKSGQEPPGQSPVLLFECAPGSYQSFMTPAFALQVARRLLTRFPDLRVILSSHLPVVDPPAGVLDASVLTFRENAELTHYCSLLVGCSSGLTWLCTSEAARLLPNVQVLTNRSYDTNAPSVDHARFGLPTAHLIELFDPGFEQVVACVQAVLETDFATVRSRFSQRPTPRHGGYVNILRWLLSTGRFRQAASFFWRHRANLRSFPMWSWLLGLPWKWIWRRVRRPRVAVEPTAG